MKTVRKMLIVLGYTGMLAMVVGAWLIFFNHHNPVVEFNVTEKSGISILCIGFGMLVIASFIVKWRFPKEIQNRP